MRGNPTVNKVVNSASSSSENNYQPATWSGLTIKSLVLCLVVVMSALIGANYLTTLIEQGTGFSNVLIWGLSLSIIPMLIIGFVIFRFPRLAMIFGIIYSVCTGFMLGVVSALVDLVYPGVALTAIMGTAVVFVVVLLTHKLLGGKLSSGFRRFVFIALISFVMLQLGLLIVSLFSSSVASMWNNFTVQMICSGVCILLATFSLLIDVDNMTMLVNSGADKQYEWLSAFSLITTLVWLYVELLELLVRLKGRDN